MKNLIFKCFTEEWLFARRYSYTEEVVNYPYKKPKRKWVWKRFFAHEPKERKRIPFLFIDDAGMMINLTNISGAWSFISWEEIKQVTIYYTMHPWDCISISFDEEQIEKANTIRYLQDMGEKYRFFNEVYQPIYYDHFSLYLSCKKRNIQIQIPSSWLENGELEIIKDIFMNNSKEIEFSEETEFWKKNFE